MTSPNLLLITADQWRGECLSCRSHPTVKTPNLDTLAEDGVLFTSHFAQCVPCGPSRASLYTGMYLQNHRMIANGVPLERRHTNVALEMRRLGFRPVLAGYTDITPDPRGLAPADPALTTYEGILPGFDRVLCMSSTSAPQDWASWLRARGRDLPENLAELYFARNENAPGAASRGATFAPARHYGAQDSEGAFVTAKATDYIRVPGSRPWFLHVSYLAPHPPYVAPEPFHDLYDPADVPPAVCAGTPEQEAARHPFLDMLLRLNLEAPHLGAAALPRDDKTIRQLRATYYGMMTMTDRCIGELMAALKETGQYDNTIVIFVSDHGELLGDHHLVGKGSFFDPCVHVPLIVRIPGRDAARGRVVSAFTENVDILPTIMDLYGSRPPRQCDGRSLVPFLAGGEPGGWRDAAHWEVDFRYVEEAYPGARPDLLLGISLRDCCLNVIRDENYKYVHFPSLPPLLFDLRNDPGELRNLAADPAYATVMLDYTRRMLSWRMRNDERTLTDLVVGPGGVRRMAGEAGRLSNFGTGF